VIKFSPRPADTSAAGSLPCAGRYNGVRGWENLGSVCLVSRVFESLPPVKGHPCDENKGPLAHSRSMAFLNVSSTN
jgi:hypothetical protein